MKYFTKTAYDTDFYDHSKKDKTVSYGVHWTRRSRKYIDSTLDYMKKKIPDGNVSINLSQDMNDYGTVRGPYKNGITYKGNIGEALKTLDEKYKKEKGSFGTITISGKLPKGSTEDDVRDFMRYSYSKRKPKIAKQLRKYIEK